jgi:saccharopine dehydrogenase-like NADP-dependent oxidoreductase
VDVQRKAQGLPEQDATLSWQYAQLEMMRDLGLFSEREIKVGGVKATPRRVL